MIRAMLGAAIAAAVVVVLGGPTAAQPPAAETKLTGDLVCGRCSLKQTPKCSNALQVKDGAKTVTYFLTDKGNGEPYHEGVCGGEKVENVTVTGKVAEKAGQKWVTPTKVELPKK
ncbi:MAG TPA: DUF6370 family protein [Urbifossiella sp.]|jgi:hypothetical protein|nr:DUF6370 family protein [Urbifossiella sp.]